MLEKIDLSKKMKKPEIQRRDSDTFDQAWGTAESLPECQNSGDDSI